MAIKSFVRSFSHTAPLPPLPKITSDVIRTQVFTHRSFYARPTHVFEDTPEDPSPDNERYEHLGDTVLGLVVTNLMWEMFPGLRVGPSTKVRAMIVGNATLAEISVRYRLPDMLRLHPAQALSLRASIHIQADVFESFVGGLYIDQGLESVKPWLYELFRPYASEAYVKVREQHGLPPANQAAQRLESPPLPRSLSAPAVLPSSSEIVPLFAEELENSSPAKVSVPIPPPASTSAQAAEMKGHLALFNQHLQQARRSVEWKYTEVPVGTGILADVSTTQTQVGTNRNMCGAGMVVPGTPMWVADCFVDGESFGRGWSSTKKSARNEAAKVGLEKMGVTPISPASSLSPSTSIDSTDTGSALVDSLEALHLEDPALLRPPRTAGTRSRSVD